MEICSPWGWELVTSSAEARWIESAGHVGNAVVGMTCRLSLSTEQRTASVSREGGLR